MFDVFKLVFVGEAFELRPERDEASVLFLQRVLFIHDSGDLLRHHLVHILAYVRLQHVQER